MKGLILKDLYTLKKQFWFVIFYCVLFSAYGIILKNKMYMMIVTMFLAVLPVTTMSYDERSGWDGYSTILPLKRSDIVKSKYYLAYLFIIPVSLLNIAISIIAERKVNIDIMINSTFSLTFAVSSAMIMIAVLFPFVFKFGPEKGRIISMLIALLIGGSFTALFLIHTFRDIISLPITLSAMSIISFIVAAVLSVISIYISIKIFDKREF